MFFNVILTDTLKIKAGNVVYALAFRLLIALSKNVAHMPIAPWEPIFKVNPAYADRLTLRFRCLSCWQTGKFPCKGRIERAREHDFTVE